MSNTERNQRNAPAYDHQLMARLWRFVRPHWRPLLGSLTMLPIASALQLAPPYLLKVAIDDSIIPGHPQRLAPVALLLLATVISQNLVVFGHMWLLQVCGQRAMHDLRIAAHRHVLSLSASFFDRTPVGKVMTRVANDVESIAEAFAAGLVSVVGDAIKLLGIVAVMLWLNVRLALLTFSVLPVLLVVVVVFQRLLRDTYRLIRKRLARINATLQEQITGMKVVQIFGREQQAQADFDEVNRAYRDGYISSIKFDAALFAFVELMGSLTVALLLWYGGIRLVAGAVSFGLLVAFIEYVQRFFEPIRDISAKYATMQQAMAASERVFELLDTDQPDCPASIDPASAAASCAPSSAPAPAALQFRDVRFGYDAKTPVLEALSFTVARGSRVAVVGATGAGKSTIARLITRLYEAQAGTILLAGTDIRDIPCGELRRRVVVLSQDVFLFAGTVRDNIGLHDPTIGDASIERAAQRVGVAQLMPIDRQLQERGANLSLGERQLVVFARALVRDPELLVLDEATASVDPESERVVQQGIDELMHKRTAIVIAHRLSTIEKADRVLVVHHGHVMEQGTHNELVSAGGFYSRLYELQYVH